jgi:uncharacterized protein
MRRSVTTVLVGVLLYAASAAGQVQDGGLPRRGSLGVALGPHDGGALVTAVTPGSAAAANDIRAGDIITTIDGAVVRTPNDLIAAITRHVAGDSVVLQIVRADRVEPHTIVLRSLPRETMPGVEFQYDAVTLGDGTRLRTIVSIPDGDRSRRPAVMLIGGGGCGSIDVPLAPDVAIPGLVRTIAARGYVTMRVEKSGVGDSRGPACDAIGYTQELDGYRAALTALKRHPSVDPARVFLLGISLGGLFAPTLANESPARGIVVYGTLAGPPSPYAGRSDRFFRELASVDVAGAWSSVSTPVLVLHGQFDESTIAADHARIAAFVNARHPEAATHVELEGLDHCWTRHDSMEKSRGHCGNGEPVDVLARAVLDFLERHLG